PPPAAPPGAPLGAPPAGGDDLLGHRLRAVPVSGVVHGHGHARLPESDSHLVSDSARCTRHEGDAISHLTHTPCRCVRSVHIITKCTRRPYIPPTSAKGL